MALLGSLFAMSRCRVRAPSAQSRSKISTEASRSASSPARRRATATISGAGCWRGTWAGTFPAGRDHRAEHAGRRHRGRRQPSCSTSRQGRHRLRQLLAQPAVAGAAQPAQHQVRSAPVRLDRQPGIRSTASARSARRRRRRPSTICSCTSSWSAASAPARCRPIVPMMLNKMLGTKFKVVEGYGSTNAIIPRHGARRARRHLHVVVDAARAARRPDREGRADDPVQRRGQADAAAMPDVPTIFDRASDDEQRQIVSLINSAIEFGRPFAAPPGVPADRLAALQAALRATVDDADFIAEATKLKFIDHLHVAAGDGGDRPARMYATPTRDHRRGASALMPAD